MEDGGTGGTGGTGGADRRSKSQRMREGLKDGLGVLAAFKDAIEETIQEARERGDFSADRAKGVMKDALGKAQAAASGAKERLDFVSQSEMEALTAQIASLKTRLEALETRVFGAHSGGSTGPGNPGGGTSAP